MNKWGWGVIWRLFSIKINRNINRDVYRVVSVESFFLIREIRYFRGSIKRCSVHIQICFFDRQIAEFMLNIAHGNLSSYIIA